MRLAFDAHRTVQAIVSESLTVADPLKGLARSIFDKQRAFLDDHQHPKRAACCGRRAGKTQGIIRGKLEKCATKPRSVCVYFAETLVAARKRVWDCPDGIPTLVADYGLDAICEVNESDHRVTFKNGSVLWVAGCETMPDARRWKGLRYDDATLDEAQDWDETILAYMVNEALSPALMDRRGELKLTGTPGPVLSGLFYEITTGLRPGWKTHHWTCLDNPHIPEPRKFIEDDCKSRGLSLDDPIIQREYFGRWVRDTNALLYQYMPGRNDYVELPQAREWRFVLGMDVGVRDLATFVLMRYRQHDPCVYVESASGESGADVTRVCEMAKEISNRYPGCRIAMDCGGLGLGYAKELQNRHGITVIPAKKTEKAAAIRLMNDQFRLGRIRVRADVCSVLTDQWLRLQIDPKTQYEKPTAACDYADAALYGWRDCWAFLAQPEPDASVEGARRAMVDRILRNRSREAHGGEQAELHREREAMMQRSAFDPD